MGRRTRDGLRDWLFTLVGLGGLTAHILWTRGSPNAVIVAALSAVAGRPIWGGLADLFGRRKDDDE